MEKRMNRAWLFFLMVAVIVAAMVVWICMGISLVVLALPVGMVMSLRHGRRAGFIWPHSGVALFAVFAYQAELLLQGFSLTLADTTG